VRVHQLKLIEQLKKCTQRMPTEHRNKRTSPHAELRESDERVL